MIGSQRETKKARATIDMSVGDYPPPGRFFCRRAGIEACESEETSQMEVAGETSPLSPPVSRAAKKAGVTELSLKWENLSPNEKINVSKEPPTNASTQLLRKPQKS